MAINYVKGQILSSVLQRDGNSLSIVNTANSTPTLYVDVANGRIGINTTSASATLQVVGNIVAGNVITGNVIISDVGNINAGNVNINNLADPVANADAATKQYVDQNISNIAVTNQTFYGDGTTATFTLNRTTTTAAALVVLNGITQLPYNGDSGAYYMNPSPSVNLVFTEAPGSGDIIDIRFL
jgi:hypothetical protein